MNRTEVWVGPEGLLSATCLLASQETGGVFSVMHHVLAPGIMAAPPHRHTNEDEFSYVIEGMVTFQVEDSVQTMGSGEIAAKPRGRYHTFWNSGDSTARVLELIAPAGFEGYFTELAAIIPTAQGEVPDFDRLADAASRYGLEMNMDSLGPLMVENAVRLPGM